MTDKLLIPSIEQRLSGLVEVSRRSGDLHRKEKERLTVTISREFGCEGYPAAQKLKELLESKTGEAWALMDQALLEEVAKDHDISEQVLQSLGEKSRMVEAIISTFTPGWHTEHDYFRFLCRHIVSLARGGNVIIVGRGSAVLTQSLPNCRHFRIIAPHDFKVDSIAKRLSIDAEEAEKLVNKKQHQRDKFIRDFLGRDITELSWYHLAFNNAKNKPEKMAQTIVEYVFGH